MALLRRWVTCLVIAWTMQFGSAYAQSPDDLEIAHSIHMQWDSPEAPVIISPIVIVGDHAIAGWTKAERGGRALLKQNGQQWEVYICGGDDLTKPAFLMQAGMDSVTAHELAKALKDAEQMLPDERRQRLSIFTKAIKVETGHPHEHHE